MIFTLIICMGGVWSMGGDFYMGGIPYFCMSGVYGRIWAVFNVTDYVPRLSAAE